MGRVVSQSLAVVTMGSPTVVHALIGGVNQNGLICQAQFLDLFHHAPDVGIEVLNLSIQLDVPLDAIGLQLSDQFLGAVMGGVCYRSGYEAEKGFLFLVLCLDVFNRSVE